MIPLEQTIPNRLKADKLFKDWYEYYVAPREAERLELIRMERVHEAMREISRRHNEALRIDKDNLLLTKYINKIYKPQNHME